MLSPNADDIELIASLELVEFETYRAEIRKVGGQEVWNEKDIVPREIPPMKGVVLRVPAKVFANGDYILALRGTAPSGRLQVAAEYSFRVVRK